MAQKNGGDKSSGKTRKTTKTKEVENRNLNVKFSSELPVKSVQRVRVTVDEPGIYKRVDVAVIDPSGRGRLIKADRNNGGFLASFMISHIGQHMASVAAFRRGGEAVLNEISFKVIDPDEKKKQRTRKAGNGQKKEQITVPPVPAEFKNENIKSWPNSSSYAQSFQNLKFSVSNDYPDIQAGELQRNTNVKYPSYIFGSGNFGTVFKLEAASKQYAIKCFTRAAPGLAERYYYISHYISTLKLPFLVDFQYLPKSVRLLKNPNQFYPVLRMEWITGTSLNEFIAGNLNNPDKLEDTAEGILSIVSRLQRHGLAHGDLSGDNILISDAGKLMLIDYDGMFVPPFDKRNAPEKGHDNFQHPKRNTHYSANLDNFSLLVIYTSLLALAEKPKLWDYNGGDGDKLIFSASDFKEPSNSELFREVMKIKGRTGKFGKVLYDSLSKDPLWTGSSPAKIRAIK